ncbi:flagellar hook protein FlgE [Sulfitobacter aestuarii]|uniref:Flagellar hook protein FlgE n=1 Tax=Sulfitobacter aestuarii TaxID=2161676 RepID=A0ABW5U1A5_9RHOB
MTISSAMQAGVSGLRANGEAVNRISENIANAGTVGYKRSFASMVTNTAGDSSGVRAERGSAVDLAGTTQSSNSGTALAVSGKGFFVVSKVANDPNPANYMLTRAGDFKPDANGDLVNAAGFFLAGYSFGEDGTVSGVDRTTFGSLETVNVQQATLTAEASSAGSISGNLPSALTGPGPAQAPFISSLSYYTPLGERQTLGLSWAPSNVTPNEWTLSMSDAQGAALGEVTVNFHDSGELAGSPSGYAFAADPGLVPPAEFTMDGDGNIQLTLMTGAEPQAITIALGAVGSHGGITQFAGDYEPQQISMDGSEVSALSRTEIDEGGVLYGVFENGMRRSLYEISIAMVDNPNGLELLDGNAYRVTLASGDAVINTAGTAGAGTVLSGALEGSTVDIAQEMTDLIQVQRAYSSNAKIITTADEMLQETTNLKR